MNKLSLTKISVKYPKTTILISLLIAIICLIQFPKIKVDTDPENMLSEKEFVRVFHHQMKKEFDVYDFIVVGVVNDEHPNGVFTVKTLNRIYELTEEIKKIDGVKKREIISPSTKDNIRQGGPGTVIFEWLMAGPIESKEEALRIKNQAQDNPMYRGTMISEDAKALCIYVPIKKKDYSYRISQKISDTIKGFKGDERFYITGLPVAKDTFGVQMFKQMAIITVITTMGLLIGLKS